MEGDESVEEKGNFDDPCNNTATTHCIKEWAILANESVVVRKESERDNISGTDVDLQLAVLPMDVTLPEGDITNSADRRDIKDSSTGFKEVVNDRHKNKRTSNVLSPDTQSNSKQIRLSDNNSITNIAFIKGKEENITMLNSVTLKESLLKVDPSLKPEQIKYVKESLKITCNSQEQKQKILDIKSLLGIEIISSNHTALNRQSRDYETLEKVIIFGVSTGITDEQICSETGAMAAKRLL